MSLQIAAQHLASKGRGPDTTLVHMSPREVRGLQQLAMAHGGSLSVNPQTGLPEAGFLSSILPMVGGAAMSVLSGGAINPMTAGLIMGGVTGLASGNLQKGLLAGLGAYGGAGLMGGLIGTGAAAAAAPAEIATSTAASEAAKQAALQTAMGNSATASMGTGMTAGEIGAAAFPDLGGTTGAAYLPTGASPLTVTAPAYSGVIPFEGAGTSFTVTPGAAAGAADVSGMSIGERLSAAGRGLSGLGTEAGREAFMTNVGGGTGLLKYGAAAAAPAIADYMAPKTTTPAAADKDAGQKFSFSSGVTTPMPAPDPYGREQRYFSPRYTPISDAQAKSLYGFNRYGYAAGGPVEEMSNQNAVGANTGFPMADINHAAYATPYQQPISQNVLTGTQDTRVDPYTGEEKFDLGGIVGFAEDVANKSKDSEPVKYVYDPKTQSYQPASNVASAPLNVASKSEWNYPVQNSGTDSISTGQPSALGQNISLGLISPMSGLQMALQDVPMSPVANIAGALLGNINAENNGYSIATVGTPSQAQAHGFIPAADSQAANVALGISNPNAPAPVAPDVTTTQAQAPISALANEISAASGNANQGFTPGIASLGMGALAALGGVPGMVGSQAPAPVSDIGTMAAFGQQQGAISNEMESQNEANNGGPSGSNGGMGGIDGSGAAMSAADADTAFARGGLSDLGGYSDGGRLLRGPGDGVSDSIPAVIGQKRPARLADGEFVVPARIVSELGNGSTEAGARKLYAMMDRIQKARGKTVGKDKVAKNSRAERFLPA